MIVMMMKTMLMKGPPADQNPGKVNKKAPSKDSEQRTSWILLLLQQQQELLLTCRSAWKITDTRDAPFGSLMPRFKPQSEQSSDDIQIQNEEQYSNSDDNDNAHVPKVQSTTSWTRGEQASKGEVDLVILHQGFCRNEQERRCSDKAVLEGHQILRNGTKIRKTALSISKLKAVQYLEFRLEELVPSLWVESERDYDISAAYGITHWWVRRKEFYINKHREPSDRDAVRSHMRILSVICIKTYGRFGYNYVKRNSLRRAD
ncbi:hypothetical protein Tco_0770170 [Tanacetum coccineum]|uniref:RNA-binding S4 domain-containing protein n=1 Tax=Tanacetum coccineum TaxID=301880 RepID=A0ABQ4ZBG7_9ASTR